MIKFEMLHPRMTQEALGYLPSFLDEGDPRPAKEQLDSGYRHGGGWDPQPGFRLSMDSDNILFYPGDPPLRPLARAKLRNELIVIYEHSYVAIIQPDHSFEVCRMD